MQENIKIFALGGLDENGKSLYVVSYNEQLYIFDAGLRYPEEKLLGVDIILPDYEYLLSVKDQIRGIFLTHGHDENIGALPFILEEIPGVDVYATNFTLLSLFNSAKRLKKNINSAIFHRITENQTFIVNGMTVHSFAVTHSVPESCGFALETEKGLIVYPGDFIIDFSARPPYSCNVERMLELAKKPTLALLSESYNASYQGYVNPTQHILPKIVPILEETKGKVFVSIYGQTISQFEELLKAAIQTKRKVYLYTAFSKDIFDLLKKHIESFTFDDSLFTTNIFENDTLVIISELGNKVFEQLTNLAENKDENSLHPAMDDTIVIASPAHTGTELSFARILDKLYKTEARVVNLTKDITSMHAGSEDLKTMLSIFKPKYYIPVRGYYSKMIENAKIALNLGYNHKNIFVYDNGMVINIRNGEIVPATVDQDFIQCSEIMVDGIGIGDVGNVVINDRRKLQQDGTMIIGISFSMMSRKIVTPPEIQIRGFKVADERAFKDRIGTLFREVVHEYIQKPGLIDFNELRQLCKDRILEQIRTEMDKEPMVLPVIISV